MRMLRRLAGARRPDHGDATHAPGAPGAAGAGGAADATTAVDLDDVEGHLRRPGASLAAAPAVAEPMPSDLLAPIAGVTVQQYVAVCKGLASHDYDQTRLPLVASAAGIDAAAWESAAAGFNARVSASPAFARHFNTLYRAARVRAS